MTIQIHANTETSLVITVRGTVNVKLFQELCNRAAHTWDQAPPQIKEFVDLVTEREVRQDYYAQAQTTKQEVEAKDD